MHPNRRFAWDDREEMLALVRQVAFCTICVEGPMIVHAPVVVVAPDRLRFHIARANRAAAAMDSARALVSCLGPDAYVSPDWYGTPDQVSHLELSRRRGGRPAAAAGRTGARRPARRPRRRARDPAGAQAALDPRQDDARPLRGPAQVDHRLRADHRSAPRYPQARPEQARGRARGSGGRPCALPSRDGAADAKFLPRISGGGGPCEAWWRGPGDRRAPPPSCGRSPSPAKAGEDRSNRLAIFDCDGTLVDSQHNICLAMERCFAAAGLVPPSRERTRAVVGLSLIEAMRAMLPDAGEDDHVELAESYRRAFRQMRDEGLADEPLYAGVAELLDRLEAEGWLLGIATGKSDRGLALCLGHHGLAGRFVTLQTADRHPSKPHPSMIDRALADAGAAPETSLMIGDTSYDMAMARAAGVTAIGVAWGYHDFGELLRAGAHHVAAHPLDILQLTKAMA